MDSLSFLIIRDDSPVCYGGTCQQISSFLIGSLPNTKISFHHFSSTDPLPSIYPDIVILSLPNVVQNPSHLRQLQKHYESASMLGLICPCPGEPLNIDSGILKKLDDFLFCPFTSTDVSLRMYKMIHSKRQTAKVTSPQPVSPVLESAPLITETVPDWNVAFAKKL